MIAANLAFALVIALGVKVLFLLSGYAFWECLTAYALCGAFSMLALSWATFARAPLHINRQS
ncbi:hypothetical protein [Paracoccus rhizosphaerae]|uniref:Uncharacterized protein n=1 Tax=Paracoccus rhizosphaerae TaxID=1133347 RepID=A0ABV6CNW3_9RHOB|nr:hypothetical protein [Paracoccus rhizosphaerae]